MKDSGAETNGAVQSGRSSQLPAISERKLKANRENAKKSTGPKTLRGKAFSRRNAVTHGLFVNYVTDFEALNENPKEYLELLNGLRDQYQPAGRAEEIAVERIALCYWRLKRAWRYENGVNLAAARDFVGTELRAQGKYSDERDKQEEAVIAQLQSAKKEIEDTGKVSEELKQRILATMPELEGLWSELDKRAEDRIEEEPDVKTMGPQWRLWARDIYTVTLVIAFLKQLSPRRWANVREGAYGRHAIPNGEALDKILRYETTIERYLSRAMQQLDHLQRRRTGELVPPPLRVHWA
jgi:hypothetical protein